MGCAEQLEHDLDLPAATSLRGCADPAKLGRIWNEVRRDGWLLFLLQLQTDVLTFQHWERRKWGRDMAAWIPSHELTGTRLPCARFRARPVLPVD